MADKYLYRDGATGQVSEKQGTVTGGTGSQAGQIPALDGGGRIDPSMMPVGVVADTLVANAFETLNAANPMVYVRSDGTVANASAASGGNDAAGFILAGAATSAPATVYFEGRITGLSGITRGARYYLSDTTPGGFTTTPVSGAGKRHQFIGRGVSTDTIAFEANDSILLN